MTNQQRPTRNQFLQSCPPAEVELLIKQLELVQITQYQVLETPGSLTDWVYFVDTGMLSIVSTMEFERDVEVGIVGREGFFGTSLVLGDDRSPFKVNVQISGMAWRIPAKAFTEIYEQSPALRRRLLLFARASEIQLASTASANGRARLEERLARWLLMTHDRVEGDRIEITHELLATMLATRRPGVTVGLQVLEGKNLIRSTRGQVTVLDRRGLEEAANGSYGFAEGEYRRLLGFDFRVRHAAVRAAAEV